MRIRSLLSRFQTTNELAHLRTALLATGLTFLILHLISIAKQPLPSVSLGNTSIVAEKFYQKDYEFTEDWFTPNIQVWEKALAPYKGKPNLRYLEIGLYEGRSALWMLENVLTDSGASLTGIDRFSGPLKERWEANVRLSGLAHKVTTTVGASQEELRRFPLETFDIIYVDGSHEAADVLEDAVLTFRLLRPNGMLIFDDYLLWRELPPEETPKIAIEAFYRFFGKHFEVVHRGYQVLLRKRPSPKN